MLKKRLSIIFVVCALCLSMVQLCWAAERGNQAVISVDGAGQVLAAPDMATVSLGVVTTGKNANLAQAENAQLVAEVNSALAGLGILTKDMQTDRYAFNPVYTNEGNGSKITGYRVSNNITVTVRDVNMVGKVIDTALQHGANSVNFLNFDLKDPTAARKVALQKAIGDAREKAEIIAAALGVRLVGIQLVTENVGSFSQPELMSNSSLRLMKAGAAADTSTPISAGNLTLDASVHIDYLIQ